MKNKLSPLVSAILAVIASLVFSGCSMLPSRKKAADPATPPPVTVMGQQSSAGDQQPQQQSQVPGQPGNQSSVRPSGPVGGNGRNTPWTRYSVFNNVFDARSNVYSDGSVLITNHRPEDIVLQVSDRVIGIPDENGVLSVMVLPSGESFTLRDYGFGPVIMVRALILDHNGDPASYRLARVKFPMRGTRQFGGELSWIIGEGDAVPLGIVSPPPIKLPQPAVGSSGSVEDVTLSATVQASVR